MGLAKLPPGRVMGWCGWAQGKDMGGWGMGGGGGMGVASLGKGMGRALGMGELARVLTHLLQLQPHFVEGSKPVGLSPGHGVLALLAFLILQPETEARGILRLQ